MSGNFVFSLLYEPCTLFMLSNGENTGHVKYTSQATDISKQLLWSTDYEAASVDGTQIILL